MGSHLTTAFNSIQFMFICCSYQNTIRLSCVHYIVFWNSFHLLLITNQSLDIVNIGERLNRSKKNFQKNCYFCLRRGKKKKKLKTISQYDSLTTLSWKRTCSSAQLEPKVVVLWCGILGNGRTSPPPTLGTPHVWNDHHLYRLPDSQKCCWTQQPHWHKCDPTQEARAGHLLSVESRS